VLSQISDANEQVIFKHIGALSSRDLPNLGKLLQEFYEIPEEEF
jgi:hypothetical protein